MGPVLPVAAMTAPLRAHVVEHDVHDVDARVIARLVRTRLALDRGRGWVALLGLVSTIVGVVGVALSVHSRGLLAVLAPVVAAVPFALGVFADRACAAWFVHLGRAEGLSEGACRRVWDGAAGADHWIDVLSSCGRPPSDEEIAAFVTAR